MNFEEFLQTIIEKAKKVVISKIGDGTERSWLEANVDSYGSPTQRIKLLVLEGSPARGYVIVNFATQTVKAFGANDRVLHTWNMLEEMLKA